MQRPMRKTLIALLAVGLSSGCDRLYERAGLPDPAKLLAEGKAIGGACRHAGRGLEDCYALNPSAPKSAIYEGWKEMNEYMAKNNMQAVPPQIDPNTRKPISQKAEEEAAETSADQGEGAGAQSDGGKKQSGKTTDAAADKG